MERYTQQYSALGDSYTPSVGETVGSTKAKLAALDLNTATAADIKAIIGNDTWTSLRCDECGQHSEVIITLGDGDPLFDLCLKCARLLTKVIGGQQ